MLNENIHYRFPLKLINSYIWAVLSKPARAILPVIGVYHNPESGEAWPGVKLIAELTGYKDTRYRKIRAGMKDLIKNELVIREKPGRHYIYCLTDLAIWKPGRSFFPIYKKAMVIDKKWAGLTPCEKSLYPVLGNKARINDPEALESEYHAMGDICEINEYIEWTGISRRSFDRAYRGLNHKNLIEFSEEDIYRYGIYVPQ